MDDIGEPARPVPAFLLEFDRRLDAVEMRSLEVMALQRALDEHAARLRVLERNYDLLAKRNDKIFKAIERGRWVLAGFTLFLVVTQSGLLGLLKAVL